MAEITDLIQYGISTLIDNSKFLSLKQDRSRVGLLFELVRNVI